MKHDQEELERHSGIPDNPQRTATMASVGSGAATGAAIGFFAGGGPLGAVVGGLVGAAAGGGIAKYVRERSKRERAKTEALDRELGVIGGDIGAAPPTPRATSTAAP